jgi:hypothetical protein
MTGMRNFEFAADRNGSHLARQRLKEKRRLFDAATVGFAIEPLGDYGHDPNPAHGAN